LPYGITQCYLAPYTSEHTRLNSSQTGRYSIYLPRGPEGWKDELTQVTGYIPRWFTRQQTVTHPGTHPAVLSITGLSGWG